MGEFSAYTKYQIAVDTDLVIEAEKQQNQITSYSGYGMSEQQFYTNLTAFLRLQSTSDIIILFDAAESILSSKEATGRYIVHPNSALLLLLERLKLPETVQTIKAAINCVNREMARRGRSNLDIFS